MGSHEATARKVFFLPSSSWSLGTWNLSGRSRSADIQEEIRVELLLFWWFSIRSGCLVDAFLCRWSGHVSCQLAVPDIDTENSGGITYTVYEELEDGVVERHTRVLFSACCLCDPDMDNWRKID